MGAMVKRLSQRSVAARSRVRFPLAPQLSRGRLLSAMCCCRCDKIIPMNTERSIALIVLAAAAAAFMFLNLEGDYDAEKAYADLKEKLASAHFSDQHTAAHLFGETLYERSGISGVTVCDGIFSFGCFHGHFARAMADNGPAIIKDLDSACISKYSEFTGRLSGCRHGIGHGLMEYYGSDLVRALKGCEHTSESRFRFGCSSGVFMEFNVPLIFSEDGANTVPRILEHENDPYYPCESVDPRFSYSCYFELPQWWLTVFERDHQKMGDACSKLNDNSKREACFRGLGFYFVPDSDYDIAKSVKKCEVSVSPLDKLNCRIGEAFSFLVQSNKIDLAAQLCDGLTSTYKKSCLEKSDLFEGK